MEVATQFFFHLANLKEVVQHFASLRMNRTAAGFFVYQQDETLI